MIRVKVCGIRREEDAIAAAEAGADLIGFVFAESPRQVDAAAASAIARRLEREFPACGRVGVFVDPASESVERAAEAARLTHVQIHGRAPRSLPAGTLWIAAVGIAGPDEAVLPDGPQPWGMLVEPRVPGLAGGTGSAFPWVWVKPLVERTRLFVAGGLDAGRVAALLKEMRPYAVDASSRLETRPGEKDPHKVRAFIEAVRAAEKNGGRS